MRKKTKAYSKLNPQIVHICWNPTFTWLTLNHCGIFSCQKHIEEVFFHSGRCMIKSLSSEKMETFYIIFYMYDVLGHTSNNQPFNCFNSVILASNLKLSIVNFIMSVPDCVS
jgi:hypothetical protein